MILIHKITKIFSPIRPAQFYRVYFVICFYIKVAVFTIEIA